MAIPPRLDRPVNIPPRHRPGQAVQNWLNVPKLQHALPRRAVEGKTDGASRVQVVSDRVRARRGTPSPDSIIRIGVLNFFRLAGTRVAIPPRLDRPVNIPPRRRPGQAGQNWLNVPKLQHALPRRAVEGKTDGASRVQVVSDRVRARRGTPSPDSIIRIGVLNLFRIRAASPSSNYGSAVTW